MTTDYHIPALFEQSLDGLAIKADGVYADCTFGGGGHSRGIMGRLGAKGRLYGFDQDIDALANRIDDSRFTFVHGNFRYLQNFMRYYGEEKIDGLLADLGVSFHHFDDEQRGFSFRFSGPLDMRMNREAGKTAADIIAEYGEEQLASLFYLYGELKQSRRIAAAKVKARAKSTINTTDSLVGIIKPLINPAQEKKELAQVFQALRIEVNHEMEALKGLLESAVKVVRPGGRIAIITYHSIEDRMVKNFIRSGNCEGNIEKDFFGRVLCPLRAVNNKVIVASEEEVSSNPRARSAKLRIAEVTKQ